MSQLTHSSRRGAVSYVLLAALALLIAGAAIWKRSTSSAGPSADSAQQKTALVTTHGEWVKIKKGNETIRAYVAYPERKTKAPAVIVIHEIFGLTD
jgi:carboxymethylenebutenolidase